MPRDLRELTRTRQFCESLGGPLETTGNPWRQGASASGVVVSQLRLVDSLLSSVSVSPLPARGGGFGCCFPVSSCAALSVPANPPWFDNCMMACSAVQCECCLPATSCASHQNLFFRSLAQMGCNCVARRLQKEILVFVANFTNHPSQYYSEACCQTHAGVLFVVIVLTGPFNVGSMSEPGKNAERPR